MQTIDTLAQEIVAREGGYVNVPDDPGGATNHGITIHTMRRLGLDLDGDGDVDTQDVRQLTQSQAIEIIKQHYFYAPGLDALPHVLQASVFDMQVNAGRFAIKILQQVLGDFGAKVAVDGVIGPETLAAARQVYDMAPDHLADAYGIARRDYYYALGDRRPSSRKYARRRDGGKGGWITRAETFISPKYHLTAQQHAQRTAQWD